MSGAFGPRFTGVRMIFPRMLYRSGTAIVLESGKYDFRIVTEDEYKQAIAEGWHLDQYAAKAAAEKPIQFPEPTRDEMEQKAKELGLKFDGRTGDKKLIAMIEEALK
jgi:hypothetical protein